jgi:hypothetical protein
VAQVGLNYHRAKAYLSGDFDGPAVTEIYYLVPRPLDTSATRRSVQVLGGVKQVQNDRQRAVVKKAEKLWDHPFWLGPFGNGQPA